MHGIDEVDQRGEHLVADQQGILVEAPVGLHRTVRKGRHGDPAASKAHVQVAQRLGGDTTGSHPLERGRLDEPVAQQEAAEPSRSEATCQVRPPNWGVKYTHFTYLGAPGYEK
ncbi:MAG: hypothetical protein AMXMBFR64_12390 [Myxococcales bacterium]